ncbi:MAG: NAD(P)/FAD-dependent oxidoreductase [Nitrospinae bacterium]|nr:NAD(P)/FAD-dependent oxidoreductase [Nitrospinota bacterium]MBF0634384.1 NAD(P)/FAD-dependent oxidoreductase [Nitrospinota bacterium]
MAVRGLKDLKESYDCVVIGGGLGGLTCANRLAKMGRSVLLLEQHTQLGGLATWFKRKKHIFDVALHGFPVGMTKTLRKYWSRDISDRIVQLKGIRFDNPQFQLETTYDREDFIRLLTDKFGATRETVERFFTVTREMNFFDDQAKTTRELFQEFFPDRDDIWRLLMEPITYANGSTLDDPAISYGIVFSNFMSQGVFTFRGGTDLFISLMDKELGANGVDVRVGVLVDKIIVDGGKAVGVHAGGKTIRARSVVSNANLKTTVLDMLDNGAVSPEFRAKTEAVRVNNSSCQVYMGIKPGEKIDFIGDLLFTSTAPKFDAELMLSKNVTSRTFSVYYPDMRPGGPERYTIVASSNARYEDWDGLTPEQYKAEKARLAEDTLNALEKYIPGARAKIDHLEVATPRTFKRYTLHVKGSSFGTKFEGLEISQNLPKEAPGLFHTGSVAIIMSGWLGAANYGVIVANEVDKYLGV